MPSMEEWDRHAASAADDKDDGEEGQDVPPGPVLNVYEPPLSPPPGSNRYARDAAHEAQDTGRTRILGPGMRRSGMWRPPSVPGREWGSLARQKHFLRLNLDVPGGIGVRNVLCTPA